MSSTRMRPFEARMAALRAAKNPGCGCGHAHGPTSHGIHGTQGNPGSPDSVDSVASPVGKQEAA